MEYDLTITGYYWPITAGKYQLDIVYAETFLGDAIERFIDKLEDAQRHAYLNIKIAEEQNA